MSFHFGAAERKKNSHHENIIKKNFLNFHVFFLFSVSKATLNEKFPFFPQKKSNNPTSEIINKSVNV